MNNQSQETNKGWSSSLGVWQGANNSLLQKVAMLQNISHDLRLGLILWYNASSAKEHVLQN
jgi:hypothetical protein